MHDSVLLNVERNQNCYGPGDRVFVTATIRSEALHTVILREFEFTLKETTVSNVGVQGGHHKKGQPQVKINIIGEQKIPVNATLYGGMHHRTELSVPIPDSHTTTTLNSAKHVDVTVVSQKAIWRVGFAPSLSGIQTKPEQPTFSPSRGDGSASSNGQSGTDEFGSNTSPRLRVPATAPARGFGASDLRQRDSEFSAQSHSVILAGRNGRAFSIANAMDGEIPEEEEDRQLQISPPRGPNWLSPEDGKTNFYGRAKAKVDRVQCSIHKPDTADSAKSK
ncbi:unnamed protein product [Peniophora sp. CBMAI 1063]|nr:unnamed protein product [Peniophora sp. CBMAI 1063]